MKEKIKYFLIGIVFLVAAAFFWFISEGFTFYVSFIPLSNEVVGVVSAVIGVLAILVGILDKGEKKDEEKK